VGLDYWDERKRAMLVTRVGWSYELVLKKPNLRDSAHPLLRCTTTSAFGEALHSDSPSSAASFQARSLTGKASA